MSVRVWVLAVSLGGAALLSASSAMAGPVSATLSANYFEVLNNGSGAPDFGGSGSPNVTLGSSLGPNGFPVVNLVTPGISGYNHTTGEITWWSPSMNSAVLSTGTGTISLPFASNMYPPNSTGADDFTGFETAYFQGAFTLGSTESVQFQLGSDDDSFIYVDGVLIGQNPGIHGVTNVNFTASNLLAGSHTLEVFFDDRERTGAYLSLNLLTTDVIITPPSTGVPEPFTLSLFGAGLAGAVAMRRRKAKA